MEKATTYFMSLSNIYLKCLGIHQNVLGTKQNYQDIVPDFKNTIKQINSAEWAQTAKPPTLGLFPTRCSHVPLGLFCGSGECMQRRSLEINNKPNKQKAEY